MAAPALKMLMSTTGGSAFSLPFSDDFNRADGGLGANWSYANDPCAISSNAAAFSSGTSGSFVWCANSNLAAALGTDQYAAIDVLSTNAGNISGAFVRYQGTGNFYIGRCDDTGSDQYQIYKRVSNTYTLLGSTTEAFPSYPFRIQFKVVGNAGTLSIWNGSSWTAKVTVANMGSHFSDGLVGFFGQRVAGSLAVDNFTCDNAT